MDGARGILNCALDFIPRNPQFFVSPVRLVHWQGQERADHGLSHELSLHPRT